MAGKVNEGLVQVISQVDAKLFNANPGRTFLSITNQHATQNVFVRFGSGAATSLLGVKVAPGVTKSWGDNTNRAVPGSEVHVIADGNTTNFYAYEHDGNLMA